MKKRLLITSIVMMLVVAVALSTATYAWFTSSESVTAESISLTAGTSGSSALGIAWTAGSSGASFNAHFGTSITAKTPSTNQTNGFQPAAPVSLGNAAPTFKTAYINAQGEFMADGTNTDVYRYTENVDQSPSNVIYLANLAASGDATVQLTASITAGAQDGTSLIRIAVFELDVQSPTTFSSYKGTLATTQANNNTAVGAIEEGDDAVDLLTGSTTTTINLGILAAQTQKAYAIYVWLDGAHFDESMGSTSASIALTFATV